MTSQNSFSLPPFFRIHFQEGEVLCDIFPPGKRLRLYGSKSLDFLMKIVGEMCLFDLISLASNIFKVDHNEATNIINKMVSVGLLVNPIFFEDYISELEAWIEAGWIDALFLHLSTRNISFDDKNQSEKEIEAAIKDMLLKEPLPSLFLKRDGKIYDLQNPSLLPVESLVTTIERRRSGGNWRGKTIQLCELSAILIYANSHSRQLRMHLSEKLDSDPRLLTRSSYCALETYVAVFDIEELSPGLYHFDLENLSLISIKEGDYRKDIQELCIGQSRITTANCVLLLSIRWERYHYRYRHSRAFRTLMIDIAESAHSYVLISTLLGMGNFITPAIDETIASDILNEHSMEETIYYAIGIG